MLAQFIVKARGRGEREPSPPDPQIVRVLVLFSRRPYYLRAWHRLR